MVLLYALTGNSFYAQGRHWFPYLLASFLIVLEFAPRAFPQRMIRKAFTVFIAAALLLYCALGGYYALQTINRRYYSVHRSTNETRSVTSNVSR